MRKTTRSLFFSHIELHLGLDYQQLLDPSFGESESAEVQSFLSSLRAQVVKVNPDQ
ncbi:MAG: hypothetical protein ACK57V_20265 [Pirellula sp.]